MPIKVRCKECSTVLTVSDKAAGRVVKCRECSAPVKVPSGGASAGAGSKSGRTGTQRTGRKLARSGRPAASGNPENLFGGLNLDEAADKRRRVCPNCTTPVGIDDVECPKCGVNIETGILSERERLRRARKGPPPEEFYGKIWKNSWRFLQKHWGYAVRTGVIWGFTATMAICSAFTLNWYLQARTIELRDSAEGNIEIQRTAVIITIQEPTDEATYDGKRYTKGNVPGGILILPPPHVGAWLSPPTYFWVSMLSVFILGFGGWAWTLAIKIVEVTLAGEKKIKRFQTDLFGSMALGFRSVVWPLVLLYPFLWIPVVVQLATGSQVATAILWVVIFLLPILLFLPAALVHMTQRYTFRAWLLNWMARDTLKTLAPSLYVGMLLFFLVLIIPCAIGGITAAQWGQVSRFYTQSIENPALNGMFGYNPEDFLSTGSFVFYRFPFLFVVSFAACFLLFGILAFPAIFMMRVYGLYGLYFRPDLSLVNEQVELEPAGFGPRFLAYLVDSILLTVLALVAFVAAILIGGLVGFLYGMSAQVAMFVRFGINAIIMLVLWGLYFASWESGQNRATLGKSALGLLVLNDDDTPITLKQGFGRALSALVTALTLYIGFVICYFRKDHRAMHDLMTKTKVVWRGEDDRQ
ncbi:MAG: RDD family protein [Planctomycetaceae bacterium]